MTEKLREGTGAGLVAFLQWAADKGVMKSVTADSYRASVTRVLAVEGDDLDAIDIRTLDVDDLFDRFSRIQGHRYTPGSLATYGVRFRRSVEMYIDYLKDPSGFRPQVSVRERRASRTKANERVERAASAADEPTPRGDGDGLMIYPFPLRSGATAYLHLPRELPKHEVERLTGFLNSIAIDPQLALPLGEVRQASTDNAAD